MSNTYDIKHPIDLHIIALLSRNKSMRFIDLKTKKTDTNLLTYHLKQLQSKNFIKKIQNTYTLSQHGLQYVNYLTKQHRDHPDLLVMLLVQNSEGDVLLAKHKEQPYIDTWSLPEIDVPNTSLPLVSVANTLLSSFCEPLQKPRHVGTAYVRVGSDHEFIATSLIHVFRFETDDIKIGADYHWVQPHRLMNQSLRPGVEEVITRSFFGDAFFFEEFSVNLSTDDNL